MDEFLDRSTLDLCQKAFVLLLYLRLRRMGGPVDPDAVKKLKTRLHRGIAPADGCEEVLAEAGHGREFLEADGTGGERHQAAVRGHIAGQEFALRTLQIQREREFVLAFPRIAIQQRRTGSEIGQRGSIGRRGSGALARHQIQLSNLLTLPTRRDESRAAVELADDLKHLLGERI